MTTEADARMLIDKLLERAGWSITNKAQVSTEEAAADGRADGPRGLAPGPRAGAGVGRRLHPGRADPDPAVLGDRGDDPGGRSAAPAGASALAFIFPA